MKLCIIIQAESPMFSLLTHTSHSVMEEASEKDAFVPLLDTKEQQTRKISILVLSIYM